MALTISEIVKGNAGSLRIHTGTITFDSSYPTGGESLTAENLGLHRIESIWFQPANATVDSSVRALAFNFDYANSKVLAYEQGVKTGSTAPADTVLFAFVDDIAGAETAAKVGGPAVAANTAYSFGGLKEVGSTANLSAFVVRFVAIGV